MEENNSQPNKYNAALAKYNTNLSDADIQARVAELIEKKVPANNTEDVKKFLFNCIDLTTLNSTDSDKSVMHFTEKVNQFDDEYPDLKNVAAICVYPNFAAIVKNTLEVDGVNIACVSGGFPSSQTFIEVKVAETALAIAEGADEIDIVISIGKFLSGDYEGMCEEIQELKEVCKERHLKVILETGALKSASNIKKASILSMYSGADFIKTSTGKQQPAATPEAAYVMCEAIKEYHQKTGIKIGFKPAGGINTVNDAIIYYTIVKELLGEECLAFARRHRSLTHFYHRKISGLWMQSAYAPRPCHRQEYSRLSSQAAAALLWPDRSAPTDYPSASRCLWHRSAH